MTVQIPGSATFRRAEDGDVIITRPTGELINGHHTYSDQRLPDWMAENCAPGTEAEVIETMAGNIVAVHLHGPTSYELAEVDPDTEPAVPRLFNVVRYNDPSGVSGVGIVGQGMQSRDGSVAMRWCVPGKPATWALFDSIDDLTELHGHGGLTVVKWVDGGN